MRRLDREECTCDIEPSFSVERDAPEGSPGWCVLDAEMVWVATCPTEAYARVVAASLECYATLAYQVCIVHRQGAQDALKTVAADGDPGLPPPSAGDS